MTKDGRGALWTPDRVDRLADCMIAEMTYKQIADEFGVTKNAIAGAINRMAERLGAGK